MLKFGLKRPKIGFFWILWKVLSLIFLGSNLKLKQILLLIFGIPKLPKITSLGLLCNILKKKWVMKLVLCMQISMKAWYKLILWFWWTWSNISKVSKIASLQCLYNISISQYLKDFPRHWNTGLVSSRGSLTSWGKGASLALVGDPFSDSATMRMLYQVDVLHQPASHPIFSCWVG